MGRVAFTGASLIAINPECQSAFAELCADLLTGNHLLRTQENSSIGVAKDAVTARQSGQRTEGIQADAGLFDARQAYIHAALQVSVQLLLQCGDAGTLQGDTGLRSGPVKPVRGQPQTLCRRPQTQLHSVLQTHAQGL